MIRLLELLSKRRNIYVKLKGYVAYDDKWEKYASNELSFCISDTSNWRYLSMRLWKEKKLFISHGNLV